MSEQLLAKAGSFCWNPDCADYGKPDFGNLRKFGLTRKGTQRYQCRSCKKVFSQFRGTVFHHKQHSPETIIECLAMLGDRSSLAAIHRIKGIKEETVIEWLLVAAKQTEEIEEVLIAQYHFSRVQLDAMWSYVGNRGEKKTIVRKTSVAPSGAAPPLTSIRG
jgi:transposase-like protein